MKIHATSRNHEIVLHVLARLTLDPDPGASQQQVRFATRSILGQCFYYRHFRVLIVGQGETFSNEHLQELADHILEFSVAGLKARA
ncbi:MAG: CerR family C-terminal domain-containing protein, partial [Candidatus Acidiferrales bacterium]